MKRQKLEAENMFRVELFDMRLVNMAFNVKKIIVAIFIFTSLLIGQTTYYSQGNGNFGTTANWNTVRLGGGASPSDLQQGDIFVIQNGHTITMDNITNYIQDMTIESGGTFDNSSNTLFFAVAGGTLDIQSGGTFTPSTGEIEHGAGVFSTVTIKAASATTIYNIKMGGRLTFDGAAFNISGTFRYNTSQNLTFANAATLSYGSSATLSYGSNRTVGTEWIAGGVPNIELASGTATISSGTYTVNDKLTVKGGTISVGGTLSYSSASLEYNVSSNINQGNEWPSSSGPESIILNSSGYTITMQGVRTIAKNLSATAGTLDINGNTLDILGTVSGSDIGGGGVVSNTGAGAAITIGNGSTSQFAQTITGNLTMDNLTVDKSYVSGGTENDLTISGNPIISSGITVTNGDIFIQGSVTVSAGGYAQSNSSTTTLSGSGNLTLTSGNYTQSGGSTTISAGKLTVTSGNISLTSGTFTNNAAVEISNASNKLSVGTGTTFTTGTGATSIKLDEIELLGTGSYTSGKAITPVGTDVTFTLSSTSTFEIASTQTIPASGTITVGNLTISGSSIITSTNPITFQSGAALTLSGTSQFDFNDETLTLNGSNTLSVGAGTILKTGTTNISGFTPTSLAGSVRYDGVTSQNLFAATYNNMTVNTSTGTLVSASSSKVTGTLTFTSGKIDATSDSLTLGVNATATASNTSFVTGSVIRETDGSVKIFSFPVGNGSNERSVSITFTTAPATSNTITVTANGTMASPTSDETGIKSVETDGYWTIATSLGALPSAYTLSLNTDGFSPAISAASAINIVRGTAETFNTESGTSESAGTDNISAGFTSAGFGDFAIGNKVSTFTWDAGGGDGLWSTNANWVGDAEPQTGDIVLFDHSVVAGTYTVTYGAGTDATNFASITVNGGGTAITLDFDAGTIDLSGTALTINNTDKLIYSGSNVNNYSSANTDYKISSTVEYQSGTLYPDTYGDLNCANAALISASSDVTCQDMTLSGAGNVSISGALTVNGLLTKGGNGTLSPTSLSTATFDLNTGNITVSGALSVSGGTFTCDGSGTLTAGSITTSGAADLDINDGSVTVNGNLNLSGNDLLKDGTGTVTVSGGTLTAAHITFDANTGGGDDGTIEVSGASAKYTISTGVTVTSGEVLNVKGTGSNALGAVSNAGTIAISVDGGSLSASTVSNSGSISISGTKSFTLSGTYSGAGTISSTGSGAVSLQAFTPSGSVNFGGSSSAITIAGAVTLDGGTFTPATNTSFTSTTFTVNGGSISASSGTIKFNGGGAQNLANGSGSATFYNLTIDNSNGFTLNDPASVAGALTLTSGKITSTTTNLLTVNGGTISGGSSTAFINGPLAYIGTGTFNFPIGKGSEYRPVQLINIVGSSPSIRFEMFASDPGGTASGLTNISTIRYWQGSLLSGSFTSASLKLQWGSNDRVDGALSNLRVATSATSGGSYTDAGNSGTTGDGTLGTVTSNSISTIQFFTLGDAASDNSLPVELVSFNANNDVNGVKLSWSVASEIDNQAFILQRREKNKNAEFELIDEVGGRGTVASEMEYEYVDRDVKNGLSYEYRLLSRDYSGLIHTYGTGLVEITVEMIPSGFVLSQNYPNPFNPSTTINFSLSEPAQVRLSVYDISGKEVVRLVDGENLSADKYNFKWNAKDRGGRSVATGVYFYRMVINSGEHILTKKMILVK